MKTLTERDWELIFPTSAIKLGNTVVEIRPFDLSGLKEVALMIWGASEAFRAKGITVQNFTERMTEVADIAVEHVPGVLALAAGLPVSDVRRLPAAMQLEIFRKMWIVNASAQEGMEKNLQWLVAELPKIINGASGMLSSFSSPEATAGRI